MIRRLWLTAAPLVAAAAIAAPADTLVSTVRQSTALSTRPVPKPCYTKRRTVRCASSRSNTS